MQDDVEAVQPAGDDLRAALAAARATHADIRSHHAHLLHDALGNCTHYDMQGMV